MKIYPIIFSLFFFSLLHAQPKFINLSTINPQIKEFYIGVDNYIEISGIKDTKSNLSPRISLGQVIDLGTISIQYMLSRKEMLHLLSIKETKQFYLKHFELKQYPILSYVSQTFRILLLQLIKS